MEELFEAKMKWSTTEVGDTIQTVDGRTVKITDIKRIDWRGDREIYIYGLGKQIKS